MALRKQYPDEQIVSILKEGAGGKVAVSLLS